MGGEIMKRTISLLLAALLLLGALSSCFKKKIPSSEIRGIERFYYTESNGSDFDMRTVYELNHADGVYTASIKPEGVKDEDALIVNVDADFVDRLEGILRENDVGRWNGFDKKDYHYIDGNGFTLHVILASGAEIDAVGLMEWPEHYREASAAFHALFTETYDANR